MTKPILYVFLISHYCEKARWALDYCGIDYEVKTLSPLNHAATAKRIGAKKSSVPILQTNSGVIQGSADIVDWAQKNATNGQQILINAESLALEKQADDVLGVHVRRWFYSETLLDCPNTVKPVFTKGVSLKDKIMLQLAWSKVTSVMIKRMDLGARQEQESKAIVLAELDALDGLINQESPYLVGQQFSNADIAWAALIAPIFKPAKHPVSSVITLPPRIQQISAELSARPCGQWLLALYENNR